MACILPSTVRSKDGKTSVVPCGKCPACRQRRAQDWIFRLRQEDRVHSSSVFATLTYSPANIPLSLAGYMTLVKKDYQLFMMRLRKNTGKKTIKYYACGEYGSTTWRPHYHAIIFDVTFDEVHEAWGKGQIYIGAVNGDSIAYTAKYMCKPRSIPQHEKDDRVPEFSLMSKNLGANYLSPAMHQFYESTGNTFLIDEGGYKQALPRYYRERLFTPEERENQNEKAQSAHSMKLEELIEEAGGIENYYRNRHESIKTAMRNYYSDFKQKRNKL